jgi:oligopeptide transport system substrate-binding protein
MKKTTYKLLTTLIVSLILVTGCAPKDNASDSTPQPDSTPSANTTPQAGESMSINQDITLDPAKTTDSDSLMVSQYIYEGLVRLDANGEVQPAIAESWIISDDQLDYIFEIRPDAKFSDGAQITTDIIVDNFNRWFDPQSPLHGDGNYPTWLEIFLAFNGERDAENRAKSLVDGIQKVDNNTVLIHLTRPEPQLLEYIAHPAFAILHPDSLSATNYGTSDSNIISSGAYIVSSWTDSGLTLAPNPEYWNPAIGEINFVWK